MEQNKAGEEQQKAIVYKNLHQIEMDTKGSVSLVACDGDFNQVFVLVCILPSGTAVLIDVVKAACVYKPADVVGWVFLRTGFQLAMVELRTTLHNQSNTLEAILKRLDIQAQMIAGIGRAQENPLPNARGGIIL